jgi:ribosomal protein S18 acetylase RimI-like enzyme
MKKENIKFFIKKLSIEEIEDFLKLNDNDFFESLSSRVNIQEYSQKLHKNATHFTLYDNNKLVGFSPCYFNDEAKDIVYISSLTIRKGYRGLGFGSELIKYIKKHANKNGFLNIVVSVHCDNKISINFYKKNSFNLLDKNNETKVCSLKYKG